MKTITKKTFINKMNEIVGQKIPVTIKDPFFVQEAYTFIYDGLGRPVAMGKHMANNSAIMSSTNSSK